MKIKIICVAKSNARKTPQLIRENINNKRKSIVTVSVFISTLYFFSDNSSVHASDQASSLLSSFLQPKPPAPVAAPTVAAPAPVTVAVTIPVPVTVRVPYTVPVPAIAPAASTATTIISTSGVNRPTGNNMQNGQYQQGYNNQQPSRNRQSQQGYNGNGYNGQQGYGGQQGYNRQQSYNGQQDFNEQQGYNPQQGQSQNYNNVQSSWSQQPQQQGYMNQQPWSQQPQGYANQQSWSQQPQQQGYMNQQPWSQQPQQQGLVQSWPAQNNYGAQSSWPQQPQQQGYANQQPWSFSPSMFPTVPPSSMSMSTTGTRPASMTSSASTLGMPSMMQSQGYMAQNNTIMPGHSPYNQPFSAMPLMPARLDSTQNIDQQVQKQLNSLAEELTDYKIFTEKLATDADSAATQSANVAAKGVIDAANLALRADSLQSNIRHKEQRVLMALENAMRIANEANILVQSSTTATKEEKEFSKTRLTNLEKTYKSMQKASITASESAGSIKNSAQTAMFAKSIFKPIFEATEAARKAKEASQNMLIAAKAAETDGPSASYDLKNSEMLVSATRDCRDKPRGDCERRSKHCEWKEATGCQFKCETVTTKSLCLGISNETKCQWESSIDMCRTK